MIAFAFIGRSQTFAAGGTRESRDCEKRFADLKRAETARLAAGKEKLDSSHAPFEESKRYEAPAVPPPPLNVKVRWKNGLVYANHAPITGSRHYPSEFINQGLGIDDAYLRQLPPDANILSLGEGMSGLIPDLRGRFRNARGLDIWYGNTDLPDELASHVSRNRDILITGSATHLPLPNRSQDLVVSHMLLSNLKGTDVDRAIEESVRVLKPGGEARHAYCCIDTYSALLALRAKYGTELIIKVEHYRGTLRYQGDKKELDGTRLIIRRRR